jgi:SprT protein
MGHDRRSHINQNAPGSDKTAGVGFDGQVTLPSVDELAQRAARLFELWRVQDCALEVRWNARLSTSAGRAFVRRGRIELNPHLLEQAPDHVAAVLAHEAAHVAAWRLFGPAAKAHGRQWRALMRLAGFSPTITHDLPVRRKSRARRGYLFLRVCDACGDRRILASVRYGRCHGCSQRDSYLVLRAPATRSGRKALDLITPDDARERCGAIMDQQ